MDQRDVLDANPNSTKRMTPQEKADKIIKLCRIAIGTNHSGHTALHNPRHAKNCAIVCVDEILEAIKNQRYGVEYLSERDYWFEVKQEIKNL